MDRARSTAAPSAHAPTGQRGRSRRPQSSTWRQKRALKPRPRNDAERRAAWWYRLHGYRILDANRRLGDGELDIVVRRGGVLVFCEVKSRGATSFEDPLEAVTDLKVRRVRSAAAAWRARHPEARGLQVRFDVIAVRAGRIEHVPDAF